MYSTVQFHRQNILNDQQISQKHTFNRPFSARYNTIRKMGYCVEFTALHCIALHCVAAADCGTTSGVQAAAQCRTP